MNPENNFTIQKQLDEKTMEELAEESELSWGKAAPYTRYETEAPPIILDNIVESDNISINAATMRVKGPTSDMRILTCHLDKATGKWVESRRASHPFIKVNMTKINPFKGNRSEGETKQICVMADSGAMCTLLTFDTCRSMGIEPETLPTSTVCITGVGGYELKSQVRQMHVKIFNPRNRAESWERIYVSPELDMSLISKDCMIRLGILDPRQFLTEKAAKSFSINTVEETSEKLSICEKSWSTN